MSYVDSAVRPRIPLSVPPSDRTESQNAVTAALSQLRAATAMAANFNVKYDRRRFVIAFITVPAERPPSLIEQMHEKCKMRANGRSVGQCRTTGEWASKLLCRVG